MGKGDDRTQGILISLNILAGIVSIVFVFLRETDPDFQISRWYYGLIALVFFILLNWRNNLQFLRWIFSNVKMFFNVVIEYRRGHLEFIDRHGRVAMYNEEVLFKKIKRNVRYKASILMDGTIGTDVQSYNCYSSLNQKRNKVTFDYGRNSNRNDNLINRAQLQFGFAAKFHDSFPAKEESWLPIFSHYTKVYDLKISFSKKNPPRKADVYQVLDELDGKGQPKLKSLPIDPLIIQKYNRVIMKVKLLHMKRGSKIKVFWEWDQDTEKQASKKASKIEAK